VILFLDFDGVLHPFFPMPELDDAENAFFSRLPRLEALLREYPAVRIVITSSWRIKRALDDLRSFFSPDIAARIIDKTADLGLKNEGYRESEARRWLADHAPDSAWVALDDHADAWVTRESVVLCPESGIGDAEILALRYCVSRHFQQA
jgi:hypothetical protein